MNKIKYIIAILFTGFLFSCEKTLDVNNDPNAAADASIELVLPGAIAGTAIHVGGPLQNLGGFWAQYYTQSPDAGQYAAIDDWNVSSDYYDETWLAIYGGSLRDLQYVSQTALEEGNNAYYLIAKCMEGYTYQLLADLYGQAPYGEAIMGAENLEPTYTSGRDIYSGVIASLDEAIARYEANPEGPNPGGNDIIFGGNMNNWVSFAYTLKFKMLMRASFTDFTSGAEILDLINGGNLLTVDATMTSFENTENKRNPFYDVEVNRLGGVNQMASQSIVNFLNADDDPRISEIFIPASDGSFTAYPQGNYQDRTLSYSDGELTGIIFEPLMAIYLFSVPEIEFLQAEALERFAGGAGAQEHYEAGISASFAMYGAADQASIFYGAGGPYEYTGSSEEKLEQIGVQKWAAMANIQNIEAFFEINRTGYPEYEVYDGNSTTPGHIIYSLSSVLGAGQSPKRLLFANISTSRNSNSPAQPAGNLAAPVWWDQ